MNMEDADTLLMVLPKKEILVCKEKTSSTPFVEISKDGFIKIMGNSNSVEADLFFDSLFHGIDKILANNVYIMIKLDHMNARTVRYIYMFLSSINNKRLITEISVFWFYKDYEDDIYQIGIIFQDLLPEISFLLYQI